MATAVQEGTVIDGKYRVVRPLASGGMGTVFVADHLFLAKPVAIKLLHPELSNDRDATERFMREARAASAIEHPNIVRVSDFGRASDGQLYLVMELLSGHTLAEELEDKGTLSATRASFIACEVLAASTRRIATAWCIAISSPRTCSSRRATTAATTPSRCSTSASRT